MSESKIRLASRLVITYTVLLTISFLMFGYASWQLVYSSSTGVATYLSPAELALLLVISVILIVEFVFGFRRDLTRLRATEQ